MKGHSLSTAVSTLFVAQYPPSQHGAIWNIMSPCFHYTTALHRRLYLLMAKMLQEKLASLSIMHPLYFCAAERKADKNKRNVDFMIF